MQTKKDKGRNKNHNFNHGENALKKEKGPPRAQYHESAFTTLSVCRSYYFMKIAKRYAPLCTNKYKRRKEENSQ